MLVLLIARLFRELEGWARKPVNLTSWMTVVTPTDHPMLVRNRCVIDLFGGVFVLLLFPFDIYVGKRAFVIGLSHDITLLVVFLYIQEKLALWWFMMN